MKWLTIQTVWPTYLLPKAHQQLRTRPTHITEEKIVELENGELTRHASSAAGVAMIGLKEDSPFEKVFLSEGQCMPLQFA
jgi:hypothetical protein